MPDPLDARERRARLYFLGTAVLALLIFGLVVFDLSLRWEGVKALFWPPPPPGRDVLLLR